MPNTLYLGSQTTLLFRSQIGVGDLESDEVAQVATPVEKTLFSWHVFIAVERGGVFYYLLHLSVISTSALSNSLPMI